MKTFRVRLHDYWNPRASSRIEMIQAKTKSEANAKATEIGKSLGWGTATTVVFVIEVRSKSSNPLNQI